jgi:hypothetical protein
MCIHLDHHKPGGFHEVCQLPSVFHKLSNISWIVKQIFASKEDLRTTKLANAAAW